MDEYKGIVNKYLFKNYCYAMIIDVYEDKVYKYTFNNNNMDLDGEISYQEYLENSSSFIYEEDIPKYIDSLSIKNLEGANNKITVSFKMKEGNTYNGYLQNVYLCQQDGKNIIVVLVSENALDSYKRENTVEDNLENKLNKMIDSVGLAILKIHNIMNNESTSNAKKDYVDAVLANLTVEYPEFNESLNDNALNLYSASKSTIMIIDDDKMTCSLIKKIFDKDYDVLIANNGKEAIEILDDINNSYNSNNISCIFLDLLMPVLDGFSVLDYLNDHNYLVKLPVIIISGNYDKETRNRAYGYQIADMLEKPFNVQVVRHRIENLIGLYRSSNSLNSILLDQQRELKNVVNSLISSYEMDNSKGMEIVRRYTRILTMQMSVLYPEYNINSNMIDKIANSAKYYSIGNYTLPKSIVMKKGIYTEEEKSIINLSNVNGANIIKHVLAKNNSEIDSKYAYEIAKYYNERYDGNGYPEGLSGNSIPLSAQIASLAIEYSNLINSIVPVDYDRVASLIIMEAGRKFNPKVVECFKKVQKEFEDVTKVGD